MEGPVGDVLTPDDTFEEVEDGFMPEVSTIQTFRGAIKRPTGRKIRIAEVVPPSIPCVRIVGEGDTNEEIKEKVNGIDTLLNGVKRVTEAGETVLAVMSAVASEDKSADIYRILEELSVTEFGRRHLRNYVANGMMGLS